MYRPKSVITSQKKIKSPKKPVFQVLEEKNTAAVSRVLNGLEKKAELEAENASLKSELEAMKKA